MLPRAAIGIMGGLRSYSSDPRGGFDIRGVGPGSYSLYATVNEDGKIYSARMPVDVGGSNIEDLNVTIGPGTEVEGAVRVEGEARKDLSNVYVQLQPRETGGVYMGGMPNARLKNDNTFRLTDVSADVFNLVLTGLPDGCYLKSIRSGEADLLAGGLDINKGAPRPVEIVVSPNAAVVSGAVRNPATGQPAPGVTVVLIPQEAERRERAQDYKMATTDQNGAYTMKNVVPGQYRAFAWEDVEPGAWMDPDVLKPVEEKGEAVAAGESEQKTVDLVMIPAAPQNSAAVQR
jgi:hypothetical protein